MNLLRVSEDYQKCIKCDICLHIKNINFDMRKDVGNKIPTSFYILYFDFDEIYIFKSLFVSLFVSLFASSFKSSSE